MTITTPQGLSGEYTETGELIRGYGYRPNSYWTTNPLYLKTGSEREQRYFYQNDHLGTPQKLLSTTGETVWDARYAAFGKAYIKANKIENPLRFAGQYHDTETNLYYNYHRYYSPELGRYITSDPIGLDGGLNTYAYVGGRPLGSVDPRGLIGLMMDNPREFRIYATEDDLNEIKDFSERNYYGYCNFDGDKLMDAFLRAGQVIGGGGQVMMGLGLCAGTGGAGCVLVAALIVAKGADNIYSGLTNSSSYSQILLTKLTGSEKAGVLINSGLDIAISTGGLLKKVPKVNDFGNKEKILFRQVPKDNYFSPAYKQLTKVGLTSEVVSSGSTVVGVLDTADKK